MKEFEQKGGKIAVALTSEEVVQAVMDAVFKKGSQALDAKNFRLIAAPLQHDDGVVTQYLLQFLDA